MTAEEFREYSAKFSAELAGIKQANPLPNYGWYPYDSLTCCPVLAQLLSNHFDVVMGAARADPVLDVGCADGDLALLFASMGCTVDAIDHPQANYNQMVGVEALSRMRPGVAVQAIDLDGRFELPRAAYGLALFLGTLYHLRNPFYILEALAARASYCILSTRIAEQTPGGVPVRDEAIAYLLGPREANNDPTNFWIFSRAGLLRLVRRAGWNVESELRLGCLAGSNPVDPKADERIFLLLRSRVRHPDMHFRLLDGWHPLENNRWCWTERSFAFEVSLPRDEPAAEVALQITVPELLLCGTPVTLSCEVAGSEAGSNSFATPGSHEYRGSFEGVDTSEPVVLRFTVSHSFVPDQDERSLGVIVDFGESSRLPFRIS